MKKDCAVDIFLLKRIAEGSTADFEAFFAFFHNKVYSYSFYFLHSEADAEEAVQEIFSKIWSTRRKLVEVEDIQQWMKTVTRNHCLTFLKKKALLKRKELEMAIHFSNEGHMPENRMEWQDLLRHLGAALEKLTPQQKKIFEMAKIEGLNRKQISHLLNLSPATVSSHLGQSVKIVRMLLKELFIILWIIFF